MTMITFRTAEKEYTGATAVDILRQLAHDAGDLTTLDSASIRGFLRQSLKLLDDRIPPRELDVSDRVSDETLARSYLLLRSDYGIGEMHNDSRGV
ncbi:MAG TPA: hypothetical protein VM943_07285 [Pyrinomonadaceae bacterium]|nr:hypothetical protein [Pyrinomonadaceae bacterium]